MRDEFTAFERLADEPVAVGHSVQAGQACFQRLLDGGYQYLGNALRFDYFTFGKTGPNGYSDRTYDEEMKKIFAGFQAQGVNEFVLGGRQ